MVKSLAMGYPTCIYLACCDATDVEPLCVQSSSCCLRCAVGQWGVLIGTRCSFLHILLLCLKCCCLFLQIFYVGVPGNSQPENEETNHVGCFERLFKEDPH